MNHQPTHSLVQNIKVESKIFKQTFDMDLIPLKRYKDRVRPITAKRNKDILSAITAKRAFDINPMPSKRYNHINLSITANRAFRGMAGLAVLYPSVLDYIGQAVKDSPVCLLGDYSGYLKIICRYQNQKIQS